MTRDEALKIVMIEEDCLTNCSYKIGKYEFRPDNIYECEKHFREREANPGSYFEAKGFIEGYKQGRQHVFDDPNKVMIEMKRAGYEQGVRDSAKVVVEDVGYDSSFCKILALMEKKQ